MTRRRPAFWLGLAVVLLGALGALLVWFVRPPSGVRYVADEGGVAAYLELRGAAPDVVTLDLGDGRRLTARRVR
jgi:hypothetical protein